jgi:hypothetical protein
MRFQAPRFNWIAPIVIIVFCLLGNFAIGCSKGKKKAELAPGEEWIADMRERIEASIADSDKKTQMLSQVDQMRTAMMDFDQLIQKHFSTLFRIDRNYESTPEEFRQAMEDFNTDRYQIRDRIVEAGFQIRELATREEWQKLTDIRKKKGLFKESMQYPSL